MCHSHNLTLSNCDGRIAHWAALASFITIITGNVIRVSSVSAGVVRFRLIDHDKSDMPFHKTMHNYYVCEFICSYICTYVRVCAHVCLPVRVVSFLDTLMVWFLVESSAPDLKVNLR